LAAADRWQPSRSASSFFSVFPAIDSLGAWHSRCSTDGSSSGPVAQQRAKFFYEVTPIQELL